MRITNAFVHDPHLLGEHKRPVLTVVVDEEPDCTIGPDLFPGGWSVSKYGPFIFWQNDTTEKRPTAADFNARFKLRFPMVIEVDVLVANENARNLSQDMFALPLARARQLVRKYKLDWKLLVSDRDASLTGALNWIPVEMNPRCRWWIMTGLENHLHEGGICGQRPSTLIRVDGVDMPLCSAHVKQHNDRQAQYRGEKKAS